MLKTRAITRCFVRHKHGRNHWSVIEKKIFPKDRALENFDDFYGNVYGLRWKSMRLGLLCKHKYVAMVNNFGETERVCDMLESDGAINIREIYLAGKRNLQEGLGGNDNQYANNALGTDAKLHNIMDQKKQSEIGKIYGGKDHASNVQLVNEDDEVEERDEGEYNSGSDSDDEPTFGDQRKSLDQAMKEDSHIDYSRIVDANFSGQLYEYIPATKIKGKEEFVPESEHYGYYSTVTDFPLKVEMETELDFPENLQLYTYEMGNVNDFPSPFNTITKVSSHFLMNGSSILPPLALNLKPGDAVFDACSSPGGKSLLMLQTLLPKILIANDIQESRANKVRKLMKQFIYDFDSSWKNHRCIVREQDARVANEYGQYDKVLVDVPCTTDRHSVTENDNNIFKPSRIKERLRLPEMQSAILLNCMRLLRPGGDIVYSTCSLSPIQNDGVVHMALSKAFSEFGITMTIKDLSMVMRPFENVFKFEHPRGLKYGQMVLPFLPANFGPMYFCKLTRND